MTAELHLWPYNKNGSIVESQGLSEKIVTQTVTYSNKTKWRISNQLTHSKKREATDAIVNKKGLLKKYWFAVYLTPRPRLSKNI